MRISLTPLVAAAVAAALASSCVFSVGSHKGAQRDAAGAREASADSGSEHAAEAGEHAKLEAALVSARMGLEIAELEVQISLAQAEEELRAKRVALAEAEVALKAFLEIERPLGLAKAHLDLTRAQNDKSDADEELAELIALYAQDNIDESTEELVIHRGKRDIAVAGASLELETRDLARLESIELAAEQRAKEEAVRGARSEAELAERGLAKARLESEKTLHDARTELASAERELAEAQSEHGDDAETSKPSERPGAP
jgi:hypothetical protein